MTYSFDIQKTQHSRLSEIDFDNLPFGKTFSDHMFVADYKDGEWTDFRVLPYGPMEMSPAMMALHYGQAIFEGMKAHRNKDGHPVLFRPEMHSQRINRSADRLGMPAIPHDLFRQAVEQLVQMDAAWIPNQEGSALYIRPVMFATDAFLGVRASETYRFVILTGPTGPYYAKPVSLLVAQKYVRAFPGGMGFAKAAGNYAASIKPATIAKEKGFDQILWLDGLEFKYIQECGTMNIFAVIGDKLITPPTTDSILAGITRDSIIQIMRHKGMEVEVRPVSIHELVEAHQSGTLKEMFGAGTAAVVSHIKDFNYQGTSYSLPAIEDRKVAPMIKREIETIKTGETPDLFGWVHPIKEVAVEA